MKILIIGSGDAGLSAAFSALKENSCAEVTVIGREEYWYPRCPLPFVLSDEVKLEDLMVKADKLFGNSGINFVCNEAVEIIRDKKKVKTKNGVYDYDSLIIATGSKGIIPKIEGVSLDGVFELRTVEDAVKIKERMKEARKAVVVGGGLIGCEAASSLRKKNIPVVLVEALSHVMQSLFDDDMCALIEKELTSNGVELILNNSAGKIIGDKKVEGVKVGDKVIGCDMVVISVGIKPNISLVENIVETDRFGIAVNERMMCGKDIYACGDCTQVSSLITGEVFQSGYGTLAERGGRAAGINAAGGDEVFYGTLNAGIAKIFGLEVGRTGMTERDAKERGYKVVSGKSKVLSKPAYFPGGKSITTKLIYHKNTRRLFGAQVVGFEGVEGLVNVASLSIQGNSTINDASNFKYCYSPPVCCAPNPFILAAENAGRILKRELK